MRLFAVLSLFATPLLTAAAATPAGLPPELTHNELPAPPILKRAADLRDPRLPLLKSQIARAGIFAAYRELAAIYERNGLYDEAAQLHRQQASLYRAKGLDDAAIIEDNLAAAIETDIRIFHVRRVEAQKTGGLYTGASLEPILGCYVGAFIDRDDNLGPTYFDENFQSHRSPAQFTQVTGRRPASLFMYVAYGQKFPAKWVADLKRANVLPHIAWEPGNLNEVRDDRYLNDFALACRAADWPVFFRFASEMNGTWTPYHGNPALYREKFRLVNQVLHRHCPRAATIWCVNNPPLGNAMDYYPGDDGCDWVGVNFYSVPWHENRRERPAFNENPLALLDPIYRRFASKKPVAICEFAASHRAKLDLKLVADFATDKITLVYGALPLLYPRVKMINWFDMDSMRYPAPGKTLSDYLLTDNRQVMAAWVNATATEHYLKQREGIGDALPPVAVGLDGQSLEGNASLAVWAKTESARTKLFVRVDGKIIYHSAGTGAFRFDLDCTSLSPGKHKMTALLYSAGDRFAGSREAWFTVPAPPFTTPPAEPGDDPVLQEQLELG